ncbi:MAG TPA: hypothetical protein VF573_12365 [Paraburkholderia sp.]|uniref:hypothetical protein n=1 Tax=Paraburkholderia sp. TaxID=1926495 RepID=UPI002ED50282
MFDYTGRRKAGSGFGVLGGLAAGLGLFCFPGFGGKAKENRTQKTPKKKPKNQPLTAPQRKTGAKPKQKKPIPRRGI